MQTDPTHRPKLREIVMFVSGLALLAHETLLTSGERYFLISASLALMGLPFVFAGERRARNGNGK